MVIVEKTGGLSSVGEERSALGFVGRELLLQRFEGVKFLFFAEMVQEFEGEGLSVEVAVEVEEMHFDAALASVVKGGASADVEHAEES